MGLLIGGIVILVLPIFTWFSKIHFAEALGTTLFFWVIGVPMILLAIDKMLPKGLWPSSGDGSDSSPSGHYERTDYYDNKGNKTGYSEKWVKD